MLWPKTIKSRNIFWCRRHEHFDPLTDWAVSCSTVLADWWLRVLAEHVGMFSLPGLLPHFAASCPHSPHTRASLLFVVFRTCKQDRLPGKFCSVPCRLLWLLWFTCYDYSITPESINTFYCCASKVSLNYSYIRISIGCKV